MGDVNEECCRQHQGVGRGHCHAHCDNRIFSQKTLAALRISPLKIIFVADFKTNGIYRPSTGAFVNKFIS